MGSGEWWQKAETTIRKENLLGVVLVIHLENVWTDLMSDVLQNAAPQLWEEKLPLTGAKQVCKKKHQQVYKSSSVHFNNGPKA